MSQPVIEPEGTGEPNGHPAWGELLDGIPQEFHPLITPKLQEWDNGVKKRLEELTGRYDPYKPLVEQNIDPAFVTGAVEFATQLQSDPEEIIGQLIDAFGIESFIKKDDMSQQQQVPGNIDPDPFEELGIDITKHPAYIAQQQALQQIQERFTQFDQSEQEKAQAQEVDNLLTKLETEHGPFNRLFVTALLAQGIDGAEAVKVYKDTVNQAAGDLIAQQNNPPAQQQQQQQVPVVMGTDGAAGSGVSGGGFDFATAKNSDVNALVMQMLNNAANADK